MRHAVAFAPLVAAFLLALAGRALADGFEAPPFYGPDISFEDDRLPVGWTLVGESSGKPDPALEAKVKEHAAAAKIPGELVTYTRRLLQDGAGNLVTVVLVDVDQDPKDLTEAVKASASSAGWCYRELGTPSRFVLVSGEEKARADISKAQAELAVRRLTQRAAAQQSRPDMESFARAALAILPDAAAPHVVLGFAHSANLQINEGLDAWDEAIKEFRIAFKEGAPIPPEGQMAQQGLGQYGLALLQRKDAAQDKEARDVLERAVALGKSGKGLKPIWVHQYNLACAHNRLSEKADALRELEASLKVAKAAPASLGKPFADFVKEDVAGDEDFASIKDDPAFKEILKKALEGADAKGGY